MKGPSGGSSHLIPHEVITVALHQGIRVELRMELVERTLEFFGTGTFKGTILRDNQGCSTAFLSRHSSGFTQTCATKQLYASLRQSRGTQDFYADLT
jgi:hypothetical protein